MITIDKRSPIPLHHQIRQALQQEIVSGRLAPHAALPTELQLCESLGVSRTTVRKALLDLAQEGLVDRKPARGTFVAPRRGSHTTIVIATFGIPSPTPGPGSELFFFLWQGVSAAAARRDLEVSVRNSAAPDDERGDVLRRLADEQPTLGLVIFTWNAVRWPHVRALHEAGLPYVLLNRYIPGREAPAVTLDDRAATAAAVRELAELGHRRIHFLGNDNPDSTAQREREAGYVEAMAACGHAEDCKIVYSGWSQRSARVVAARDLKTSQPATAWIASSGYLAAGVVAEAQAQGLRVPGDLSVIGFDDTIRTSENTPPITGISYVSDQLGEAVVDILCRQAGGDLDARRHLRIPTRLIRRDSCSAPARVAAPSCSEPRESP